MLCIMKVLTIKSSGVLDVDMQNEVHYAFGMEHHTDYVFKPREDRQYSATIVIEDSAPVIEQVIAASVEFPAIDFVVDDLDMEQNSIERYLVKDGSVTEQKRSGWQWEA
jgi:hypothetical protein